ncbi:MAG: ATP-binding protein [Bacteroides sp.]|nr:ATP-binding protein [Bacteroides sp.]
MERYIKENGSTICVILSLLLFFFSLLINTSSSDTRHVAAKTGKRIEKRIAVLDAYIGEALDSDHSEWLVLKDFPDDMVLYRYVYDTLQCWTNQFTVNNDDISSRLVFQRLWSQKASVYSPLSNVTGEIQYMNFGQKWYLVKSVSDGINCKVIAGLEIKNSLIENMHRAYNGVNKNLKLPGKYTIMRLMDSGGSAVTVNGTPVFKILSETSQSSPFLANSILRWLALLMITVASVLYLWTHRSIRIYLINIMLLIVISAIAYIWGIQMQEVSAFFSPTVYADGTFLYSFGALTIINIAVFLGVLCTYIVRDNVLEAAIRDRRKRRFKVYGCSLAILFAAVAAYMALSLHSLMMNSSISLELYIWSRISAFTFIVYATYSCLMFCLLLIIQMLEPVVHEFFGKRYNVFGTRSIIFFALACATYFTIASGTLGFRKEQDRMIALGSRLAVDRDLEMEIQLRGAEDGIANDQMISAMSMLGNSDGMILSRLTESHLNRISQDYAINVTICKGNDIQCIREFSRQNESGSPISPNSRFVYTYDANGKSGYIGSFIYYSSEYGLSRVFVEIEPKANKEERGYYSILGKFSNTGGTSVPRFYSYAKYISGTLASSKGTYAYPTLLYGSLKEKIDDGASTLKINGFTHFINRINDNETIIISRRIRGAMTYIVTFSYLFFVIFAFLFVIFRKGKGYHKAAFRRNYYRTRINFVLFISLFATLMAMTLLSVTFVQKRNETNMYNMMSSKITTIQAIFENKCNDMESTADLGTREFSHTIENIGNYTKSDITLYAPNGKVFRSTTPEVFERRIISSRINKNAYYNIKYRSQRFYIRQEQLGDTRYYSLYAPIINHSGKLLAIIGVPYTEQDYDFKQEALFHAASIVNIFFLLLAITLLVSTSVVNAMFRPLMEMGKKMSSANLHGFEYIIYKRDDEISTLVDAYNRMVHDLSESTKKLTRSERDKAWSEMARQVAHEIKNPLTPIKLEIQRLIRLKQKNSPQWETRFDEVARIVLEHIDILTDTANEFSTFAKLYTEEPVLIDLDRTLRDQIYIFDNRENIRISYIGFPDAEIMAPRPQLIRVFVNLITNAIQAVEIQQNDSGVNGGSPMEGKIMVSLRNSTKDGYYDVVVEDNGPGVKEENQDKLFTPNFTTKSSGTGLGLAICRNIIEKCDGEITYRRSFVLGGASFIVTLPKKG